MGVNPYTDVSLAETWRAVPDFQNVYEVSDQGRVRRIRAGSHTSVGRVIEPHQTKVGPTVNLTRMVKLGGSRVQVSKRWLVARLVWAVFVGPLGTKEAVKTRSGDLTDTRLCNLRAAPRRSFVKLADQLNALAESVERVGEIDAAKKIRATSRYLRGLDAKAVA